MIRQDNSERGKYVPTNMMEYPPKLPHGSGRMMALAPRWLLLAFQEHSSQQDVRDRLQKRQEKVPGTFPLYSLLRNLDVIKETPEAWTGQRRNPLLGSRGHNQDVSG